MSATNESPGEVNIVGLGSVCSSDTPTDNSNSPPDIRSLSRAIVRGSEASFETFYELYSARLYRLLLILTRGEEELAREIQQVVMIKVARKFKVFESDGELWAWLSQVARNAFVDHVRKQTRHSARAVLERLVSLDQMSEAPADKTMLHWLDHGLETLDLEERELVEEVYYQGRAQKELASESGRSVKSVESKLARIREKLRQFIFRRIKDERETT